MAKLFINKDIVSDADKSLLWMFTGQEGVSYPDIKSFIESMPADDEKIELEFHSCGGDCREGWSIYDELRASGKEIHATNVGTCASMATILFLAAKKENRVAREHSQFLIHNAYIPMYQGEITIERSQQLANDLLKERNKLLDVYAERTGTERDILAAQMDTNDFFDAKKAIELGFVDHIEEPLSASAQAKDFEISLTKNITGEMDNKSMMAKVIDAIKSAFNAEENEVVPVALTLTSSDGVELTIEREEGEPQVGDAATPDGNFILEDGRKIIVDGGKIVEIVPAEEEEKPSEESKAEAQEESIVAAVAEENNPVVEEPIAEAESNAEMVALQSENDELKAKIEELKAQAEANAEILDVVAKAGGKEWLEKAASSHYVAPSRVGAKNVAPKAEEPQAESFAAKMQRIRNSRINTKK